MGEAVKKDALLFWGMALLHRSHQGAHLGLHWAWGKAILQRVVMNISDALAAPLSGYADHMVDSVGGVGDVAWLADYPNPYAGRQDGEFFYSVRLHRCYLEGGDAVPCDYMPSQTSSGKILESLGHLMDYGRVA